ncbi:MAG: amino acid-binding protein [Bacteroidaceae bacterium]|nr:amino acid-binding protein [Bacteroidaceae bacterium]
MTIHQISIFIENRSGTMIKVLNVLKQADVDIIASTVADTAEYGIYRIICSDPKKAHEQLKNAGIQCTISDVFALELDNLPGKAADAVAIFSEAGISISYLYSFLLNGKGILIFRTDDNEKAKATIKANGLKYITEPKLPTMA